MGTEKENPFPIHLLNDEQQEAYYEWRELFDICHNPPPSDLEIGAIVMPTGYWLDRAPKSLEIFKDQFPRQKNYPPQLVVTGKHSHTDLLRGGASASKVVRTFRIYGGLTKDMKDFLLPEDRAENTKEQAENVYSLINNSTITEPIVSVVSAEHLPRVYSTFVRTILNKENSIKTRLFSVAVFGDWMSEIPKENRGKRYEQIAPEVKRIHTYRKQGDVAELEDLTEYTLWLRRNI